MTPVLMIRQRHCTAAITTDGHTLPRARPRPLARPLRGNEQFRKSAPSRIEVGIGSSLRRDCKFCISGTRPCKFMRIGHSINHKGHRLHPVCSALSMSKQFLAKKKTILQALGVSDDVYTDLSPKGSVDDAIRDLVTSINSVDSLVTTSSCSGRFVVYLDGPDKLASADNDETASRKAGKGGGTWLFTSHTPVTAPLTWQVIAGKGDAHIGPATSLDIEGRLVHCKFEPMILHILASTLESAKAVLAAAQVAGFRESGISSITQSSTGEIQMVMVAVRTTGLAFDNLVASCGSEGTICPAVDDDHLQRLALQANRFFAVNATRVKRFEKALAESRHQSTTKGYWESTEDRAVRKRAEGQAAAARVRPVMTKSEVESDDTIGLEGLGFQ